MPNHPTGTVTFLFTDIEGSTQRWEKYPDAMSVAVARHDALMRHAIESTPCETRVGPIRVTISIGVSFHCPDSSLEEDLSRADVRLYEAKQNGRNRVVFGDHDC